MLSPGTGLRSGHGIVYLALVCLLGAAAEGCAQDLETDSTAAMAGGAESEGPRSPLSYVAGGFWFGSSYRIDNDPRKLMFPYSSGNLLVFLEIDPNAGRKRILAYARADLIRPRAEDSPTPVRSYRERPADFSAVVPGGEEEKILAVLPGPSFVTTDGAGRLMPVREGPALGEGTIHDYLPGDPPAFVTPEGFFVGGTKFFACREVLRAEVHDGWYAVGFKDYENRSAVCLLKQATEEECDCEPLPGVPEYGPSFSGDGRFLAVAAGTAERSALRVYRRSGSKAGRVVLERKRLKHYDITNRDFSYRGSFRWLENDLFFLEYSGDGNAIFRVRCERNDCQTPVRLDPPACVALHELPPIQDTENPIWLAGSGCAPKSETGVKGQVDLRSIEWVQPFHVDETTYLAAESVLRFQHPIRDIPIWITRILILRLP